jgi:hypothetical protein
MSGARYPSADPRPGTVAWEMARRAVACMLRRVAWRAGVRLVTRGAELRFLPPGVKSWDA